MEENVMIVPDEEIGVDELEENLTGEVEQQQAEENDELVAALRQGMGELFEDGWTTGELDAMTQDEGVKREIASGHGMFQAGSGSDDGGEKGEDGVTTLRRKPRNPF